MNWKNEPIVNDQFTTDFFSYLIFFSVRCNLSLLRGQFFGKGIGQFTNGILYQSLCSRFVMIQGASFIACWNLATEEASYEI